MRRNFSLDAGMRADAREAYRILEASGWPVENALTVAARMAVGQKRVARACSLEEGIGLFLRDCLRRQLRSRSVDFYEGKLRIFEGAFEGRSLSDFERGELREWLLGQVDLSEATRGGYLRAIRALFRWSLKQDPPLCLVDPTVGLVLGGVREARSVEVMGVDDVAWCLNSAGSYSAALALMLFAGIRPSEISARDKPPLLWGQIDFKHRSIRIEAAMAKTRVARVLEGLPGNLWEWLRLFRREREEPVCGVQLRWMSRYLMEREGCPLGRWPQDVCRHSFATYHVAAFNDVERTSLLMGHEGRARLLHQRYRGLATAAQGKRFFGLVPG